MLYATSSRPHVPYWFELGSLGLNCVLFPQFGLSLAGQNSHQFLHFPIFRAFVLEQRSKVELLDPIDLSFTYLLGVFPLVEQLVNALELTLLHVLDAALRRRDPEQILRGVRAFLLLLLSLGRFNFCFEMRRLWLVSAVR